MKPGDYPAMTLSSCDAPNEGTTNRINRDSAEASRGGSEEIIIDAVGQDEIVEHDSELTEEDHALIMEGKTKPQKSKYRTNT